MCLEKMTVIAGGRRRRVEQLLRQEPTRWIYTPTTLCPHGGNGYVLHVLLCICCEGGYEYTDSAEVRRHTLRVLQADKLLEAYTQRATEKDGGRRMTM